ncbi:TonB family protein [Sphingopyxis fribergensis]
MAAPGPPPQGWARGLKSVENIRGGATLYKVMFGERRKRSPATISFEDLEAQHRSDFGAWMAVIGAHLLLVVLPVVALLPDSAPSPPPEKGLMVDLVMEPDTKAGKGRAVLAESGGARHPAETVGVGPGADVLAAAKAKDSVPLGEARALEEAAPAIAMTAPVALPRDAPAPPGSAAGGPGVLSPDEARWEGQILARIAKRKRYPKTALAAGTEDNVLLRLVLDRDGKLVRADIARSIGNDALNGEVLALAKRGSPYPRPPASIGGATVTLLVPVEFVIKKAK